MSKLITDIEKLPYPMFKTTAAEKQELLRIFNIFKNGYYNYSKNGFGTVGICGYITSYNCGDSYLHDELRTKIQKSLKNAVFLHRSAEFRSYLDFRYETRYQYNLHKTLILFRMIWISKLLTYK